MPAKDFAEQLCRASLLSDAIPFSQSELCLHLKSQQTVFIFYNVKARLNLIIRS